MSGQNEIDAWFGAAGPREEELRRVDELVMAAAPGIDRQLVPVGCRSMLGYGLMPYRPRSAKETTMWPLIALAAQKRHLSLYVCAVVDGGYLAEARAERLGQGLVREELHPVHLARRGRHRRAGTLVRDAVAATRGRGQRLLRRLNAPDSTESRDGPGTFVPGSPTAQQSPCLHEAGLAGDRGIGDPAGGIDVRGALRPRHRRTRP